MVPFLTFPLREAINFFCESLHAAEKKLIENQEWKKNV